MKTMRGIIFAAIMSTAVSAAAAPCPDGILDRNPEGDQDRDGILNEEDNCCFVATLPDHNEETYCPSGEEVDINMNGDSAFEEGQCCVDTIAGGCRLSDDNICEETEVPVSCDRLLLFTGMSDLRDCVGEECICFSIEDFDEDYDDTWGDTPGAVDNCPTVRNSADVDGIQANRDDDRLGDACDICKGENAPLQECVMQTNVTDAAGSDRCPENSFCVPYVDIRIELMAERLVVEYFCSTHPEDDKDLDTVPNSCDNCPNVPNTNQEDSDEDGVGDACPMSQDTDTTDTEFIDTETSDSEHEDTGIADTESDMDAGLVDSGLTDGGDASDDTDTSDIFDTDFLDSETVGNDTDIKDTEDTETIDTEDTDTADTADSETGDSESDSSDSDTLDDGDTDTGDTETNDTDKDTGNPEDTETEPVDTDTEKDTDDSSPPDQDGDGVPDISDNCPTVANGDQDITACQDDIYKGGACDCSHVPGRTPSSTGLLSMLALLFGAYLLKKS